MKRPMFRRVLGTMGAAALALWLAGAASAGEHGVTQKYKRATAPFDDARIQAVEDLPTSTVKVEHRYPGKPFRTETRKEKIQRFKCSQCHNNKPVTIAQATETAHGAIALDHGGKEKPLACFTCHNRQDRDLLTTESGETVDMDHSYELCGQCHFRQKKDWAGGAHGKRVGYWAGERVVKTCTACHDPHAPRFKKRWPVTYSPPTAK